MGINSIRSSDYWILTKTHLTQKRYTQIQPSPSRKKKNQHTLNYAPDYTLYSKLFECTLCTVNYYIYNTLHPSVTFAVMFNRMLLHMISTCVLLKCNKLKRLKHPTSKSIKTQPNFFRISLPLSCACSLFPKSRFL